MKEIIESLSNTIKEIHLQIGEVIFILSYVCLDYATYFSEVLNGTFQTVFVVITRSHLSNDDKCNINSNFYGLLLHSYVQCGKIYRISLNKFCLNRKQTILTI